MPLGLSIFVDKVIYYVSMNSAGIYIFLQDYIKVLLRWKLVQLGLDDHYKRLNEVRGKDRMPHTQVTHILYTLIPIHTISAFPHNRNILNIFTNV